jgi:integrase
MRGSLPQKGSFRMSRQPSVPSYRLHKQSGQAVVTLPDGLGGRRDVLLGNYGTPESRAEYVRVLGEWEARGRRLPAPQTQAADPSVNELILASWRFADGYYVKHGEPTAQLARIKSALRPLKEAYGHTPVCDFGPLALKAVRERMIQKRWTRGFVNSAVGCLKRVFKWAVENELVPPSTFHGLQAVAGLKKGRLTARETQKVRPVADEHVEATLPFLMPSVRGMVQVQRLTGMRPGEVVLMRPCDIDRSNGKTWVYRPEVHKTEHHDIHRLDCVGPRAQALLLPFLEGRHPGQYLFSPREGMAYIREQQRLARKTKVQPSQVCRKKAKTRKQPGERYTPDSYAEAVERACVRADEKAHRDHPEVPADVVLVRHWHPNQLRHTLATEIRKEAGIDAARAQLGHTSPVMTEVYAELDAAKAAEVMKRLS